ncbi:MAG: hypothetical protein Q4B31_04890 [Clostridia bacterium]|nr:hypothetical protein [Clostridia bacterium]
MELTKDKKCDTVAIGLKLNKRTDADILSAVGGPDTRQKELRRYMRVGLLELNRRREIKRKKREKAASI